MRKRQQKRLHKGPFRVLGFRIAAALKDTADLDTLIDQFTGLLDGYGIYYWGMFSVGKIEGCVELGRHAPDFDEKRQAVIDWLDGRDEIVSVEAGSIADLYYSKDLLGWLSNRLDEVAQDCHCVMIPRHGR